jgi:hypothetical protein
MFVGNHVMGDYDILGLSSFTDYGVMFTNVADVIRASGDVAPRGDIALTTYRFTPNTTCECYANTGMYKPNIELDLSVTTYIQHKEDPRWADPKYGKSISDPRVRDKWDTFWFSKVAKRISLVEEHEKRHREHAKKNFNDVVVQIDAAEQYLFSTKAECESYARKVAEILMRSWKRRDDADYERVERGLL